MFLNVVNYNGTWRPRYYNWNLGRLSLNFKCKNWFSYKFLKYYFCRTTFSSQTMTTVFNLTKKTLPKKRVHFSHIWVHLVNTDNCFYRCYFLSPIYKKKSAEFSYTYKPVLVHFHGRYFCRGYFHSLHLPKIFCFYFMSKIYNNIPFQKKNIEIQNLLIQ